MWCYVHQLSYRMGASHCSNISSTDHQGPGKLAIHHADDRARVPTDLKDDEDGDFLHKECGFNKHWPGVDIVFCMRGKLVYNSNDVFFGEAIELFSEDLYTYLTYSLPASFWFLSRCKSRCHVKLALSISYSGGNRMQESYAKLVFSPWYQARVQTPIESRSKG